MKHHQFSLTEIENWIPWEREVYVSLLLQYLEEQEMKERQNAANRKHK
jgi:hypothetical protein